MDVVWTMRVFGDRGLSWRFVRQLIGEVMLVVLEGR